MQFSSFPNSVWERLSRKLCFPTSEAELRGYGVPSRAWDPARNELDRVLVYSRRLSQSTMSIVETAGKSNTFGCMRDD
jgi:hypothetical protein